MNTFPISLFYGQKTYSVNANAINKKSVAHADSPFCEKACKPCAAINSSNHKAYCNNIIAFKGNKEDLLSGFLNSESPKIYQFLCETKTAAPLQVRKFLDSVLADSKLAESFVKEITAEPRKSVSIVKNLTKKLGGPEAFRDWYVAKDGYMDTFLKLVGENFYPQAKTESDMLEIMPNWHLCKIWEKSSALGHDPIIGELPVEFGNRNSFIQIVNKLRTLSVGEKCNFSTDKNYTLEKIFENEKSTNKVTPEGSNLSYIIKVDNLHSDPLYDRMRPNSVYLESAVGHYVTKQNCNEAAKFYYYDLFHDAALFDFVEGELPEYKNVIERNRETPDLLSLGIFCNDISPENYVVTPNGLKLIDFGHVNYFDKLKPGAKGYTIDLPNFAKPNFLFTYVSKDIENFVLEAQKGAKHDK